ncbi:MAG: HAMP domain-containing histidine kinase [Gammaproteobacteria bacterium]|nr:HAMP domain-containing histidine kinase [Gammaproteobacteria bacterium]
MELQESILLNPYKITGVGMTSVENEKMQFAANLTHDLRSPLSGIRTTAEVLKKNAHNADDQRLLQNIVNTTTHLADIIDHILHMSKESSKEDVIYTFSLRQLMSEVVEVVALSAEAKGLALYADLTKDYFITADRYRCFRILLNLVENAVKYTQKGHVLIRSTVKNDLVMLEVEDTGIGISKAKQVDIFNCYTQLESGSLHCNGIGLGLHLVLLFTKQMGGDVTVKSRKNKGSTFSFSFPSLSHHEEVSVI